MASKGGLFMTGSVFSFDQKVSPTSGGLPLELVTENQVKIRRIVSSMVRKKKTVALWTHAGRSYEIHHPSDCKHYYLVDKEAKLGVGTSGDVCEAYPLYVSKKGGMILGKKCACKSIKMSVDDAEEHLRAFKREVDATSKVYEDVVTNVSLSRDHQSQFKYIFSPILPGKSLFADSKPDLTQARLRCNIDFSAMSFKQRTDVANQIAEWLFVMHTSIPGRGDAFYHGDISHGNFHFDQNEQGDVTVYPLDFGTARKAKTYDEEVPIPKSGSEPGTLCYLAPEVFNNKKTIAGDYYAAAGIYALIYGAVNPFRDKARAPYRKAFNRISPKPTLYFYDHEVDPNKVEVKGPCVIVIKNKKNEYAAIIKEANNKLYRDFQLAMMETKPTSREAPINTFVLLSNIPREIIYYDDKGNESTIEGTENILELLSKVEDKDLVKHVPQIKKALRKMVDREGLGTVMIKVDLSVESTEKLNQIREEKKVEEAYDILYEIWMQRVQRGDLTIPSHDDKVEVETSLNFNGFFKGPTFVSHVTESKYCQDFIKRSQEYKPSNRPTPIEHRIFYGMLHYAALTGEDCHAVLHQLSTKGIDGKLDIAKDNTMKQFCNLANKFLVRQHKNYKLNESDQEQEKIFWKLTNELFSKESLDEKHLMLAWLDLRNEILGNLDQLHAQRKKIKPEQVEYQNVTHKINFLNKLINADSLESFEHELSRARSEISLGKLKHAGIVTGLFSKTTWHFMEKIDRHFNKYKSKVNDAKKRLDLKGSNV